MPYSYLLVQTGMTLNDINSIGLDFKTLTSLMVMGLIALIPTLLSKKIVEEPTKTTRSGRIGLSKHDKGKRK